MQANTCFSILFSFDKNLSTISHVENEKHPILCKGWDGSSVVIQEFNPCLDCKFSLGEICKIAKSILTQANLAIASEARIKREDWCGKKGWNKVIFSLVSAGDIKNLQENIDMTRDVVKKEHNILESLQKMQERSEKKERTFLGYVLWMISSCYHLCLGNDVNSLKNIVWNQKKVDDIIVDQLKIRISINMEDHPLDHNIIGKTFSAFDVDEWLGGYNKNPNSFPHQKKESINRIVALNKILHKMTD